MRWIVVGAAGMLGQDLVDLLTARGHDVLGVDRESVDVVDPGSVAALLARGRVDVLVNCAAWTAVDAAEEHEDQAFAVNAVGPANLARAAHRAGARMVHVSTDYVFDGGASSPYDEDAPPAPRSAYGRTKAAGEWAVRAEHPGALIVRTAWLYGARGACFPRTIARLAAERGELTVVDDQTGQPTWTVDLADLIARLVEADAPAGTYHGTSSGATTWFGFARAVVTAAGLPGDLVRPTTTDAGARPAPRPTYSVLGHERLVALGLAPVGPWDERWALAAQDVLSAR